MTSSAESERKDGQPVMNTPPVVSSQEWEAAREQLLVKEKAHSRARDALAAERRRMPWMAVETAYAFEGPAGKLSLPDLFDEVERQGMPAMAMTDHVANAGADVKATIASPIRTDSGATSQPAPAAPAPMLMACMMPWSTPTSLTGTSSRTAAVVRT